jgi:hypothetical protein
MNGRRLLLWTKLNLIALLVVLLTGCPPGNQTTTTPPPTPTPMAVTRPVACPVIDDPDPSCPGVAFTESKLTCSGPITAGFDSAPHANRIEVAIPNNSTVTGNARGTSAVGGPCHGIGAKFAVVIKFGAQYSGDIGPNAPICIAHSKVTFPQFDVGGSIFNSAWNPTIKSLIQDKVNQKIDQAVVDTLNASPGSPPRCSNFTPLP